MSQLSESIKESSALASMQRMLEKYAEKKKISFDEAMKQYGESESYAALFDYDTELWKEGPDYLLEWFEEEISKNK